MSERKNDPTAAERCTCVGRDPRQTHGVGCPLGPATVAEFLGRAEPDAGDVEALAKAIAKTLDEFSAFVGATDWSILQSNPPALAEEIYRY